MSLIEPADQKRLADQFSQMSRRVRVLFFTQTVGCDTCVQAREIVDKLPPLSDRISIEEVNLALDMARARQYDIDRAPAIAILAEDETGLRDSHIRFLGAPSGYEFIALVRAIILVGGGESVLSPESRERVMAIDRPLTIRVFSTPTCPHCPRAVTLAHEIAWANPHVTAYAIEATAYPDLAREYRVTGVPKTIIGDTTEILGAVPEDTFVEQTLAGFAGLAPAGDAQ